MPAPATSSRHLYTGHHQGNKQAAPWLRAHPAERAFVPGVRSTPSFGAIVPSVDASAVVHTLFADSYQEPRPLSPCIADKSYKNLVTQLESGDYAGKDILICRHHGQIIDLANALLTANRTRSAPVLGRANYWPPSNATWPGKNFRLALPHPVRPKRGTRRQLDTVLERKADVRRHQMPMFRVANQT